MMKQKKLKKVMKTQYLIIKLLLIIFSVIVINAYNSKNNELKNIGETDNIILNYKNKSFDVTKHKSSLVSRVINSKNIKGPIKGIKIEAFFINSKDTLKVCFYRNSKYFYYDSNYYESKEIMLSNDVWNKW